MSQQPNRNVPILLKSYFELVNKQDDLIRTEKPLIIKVIKRKKMIGLTQYRKAFYFIVKEC